MPDPTLTLAVTAASAVAFAAVAHAARRRSYAVVATSLFFASMAAIVVIPASWVPGLLAGADGDAAIAGGLLGFLAGNLGVETSDAVLICLVNLAALVSGVTLRRRLAARPVSYSFMNLLVLGANGLILSRDLTAGFVFLVATASGMYGMISVADGRRHLRRRFLLTSSLALVVTLAALTISAISGGNPGFTPGFLLLAGLLFLLSMTPVSSRSVRDEEAAVPGVAMLLSAVQATAVLAVVRRFAPVIDPTIFSVSLWIGAGAFVVAGLGGLGATAPQRMLGYASVGQIGLVIAVLALVRLEHLSSYYTVVVAGGLLVTHLLSSVGLLCIEGTDSHRARPPAVVLAVLLTAALVGLPPFPGFWSRWQLVNTLIASGRFAVLALISAGFLIQAACLFRRLFAQHSPAREQVRISPDAAAGAVVTTVLLGLGGVFAGWTLGVNDRLVFAPVLLAGAVLFLEWVPARIRAYVPAAAIAGYAYFVYPLASGLALILGAVFVTGGIVAALSGLDRPGTPRGTASLHVLVTTGLTGLVIAAEPLTFVFLMELVAAGGLLLVWLNVESPREIDRMRLPVMHVVFSLLGTMLITAGLAVAFQAVLLSAGGTLPEVFGADGYVRLPALTGGWPGSAEIQEEVSGPAARVVGLTVGRPGQWADGLSDRVRAAIFILIGLAVFLRLGGLGFHPWIRATYVRTRELTASFFLSTVDKVCVLTLFMLMLLVGASPPGGAFVFAGLALGTAAVGAILALVQDNARSLLSWASISHMGFIAVGIATATDAGWVSAIQATTVHFLCFLILFRLTRPGALDNNRVISTTALLIAVATLSGLPPFSGFVPRWYVLQSMFEREWYWHAGLGAVVSLVSLGYLFRLVRLALHGRPITPDAFTDRPGLMDLVLAAACATGLVGLALFPDVLTVPATGYTATLFAGSRPVQEPLSRALAGWARGWYRYPLVAVLLGGSVWYSLVPRKPSAGASALRIRGINILRSSWLTDFWVGLGDVVARAGSIVARLAAVRNRMYAFITVGCTVLLYVVIAVVR